MHSLFNMEREIVWEGEREGRREIERDCKGLARETGERAWPYHYGGAC